MKIEIHGLERNAYLYTLAHLALFVFFAGVFYLCDYEFWLNQHDGQNLYAVAQGIFDWRTSWLAVRVADPLQAMGAPFWPLNPSFIPFLWPFAWTNDPWWRMYGVMVLASATCFLTSFGFYRSLRLRLSIALPAAWLSFVLVMLQHLDFSTGTDPLISIAYVYLCLALLAEVGRHRPALDLASFLGFQLVFTLSVLAHPAWHLIGLPMLLALAGALVLGAKGWRERGLKIACVLLALLVHYAAGSYEAIYLLASDTARVQLANNFLPYAHIPYLAGLLFRGHATELAWGLATIFGLAAAFGREGALAALSARPRLAGAVAAVSLLIFGCAVLAGLVFIHSGLPWFGPKPSYLLYYSLPLMALYAALGVRTCAHAVVRGRAATAAAARRRLAFAAPVALAYLAWHTVNSRLQPLDLVIAFAVAAAALLIARTGRFWISGALAAVALLAGIQDYHTTLSGGYARYRDPEMRLAIRPNPVVDYLRKATALVPGSRFRGYVDDAYQRPGGSHSLIENIITNWASNWRLYGDGMKLFNWSIAGIPILSTYNPYLDAFYFKLFSGLLNAPSDRHTVNYLTITEPNSRILRMLGLRYLVRYSDQTPLLGSSTVASWKRFRVDELSDPNLGTYSPVEPLAVETADAAIARMASAAFDPKRQVVLTGAEVPDRLVPAAASELEMIRGGFRFKGRSEGRALVVLPYRFSHCLVVKAQGGDRDVRLLRVNLVETGVLFERETELEVHYRYWPLASLDCARRDLAETRRLLGKPTTSD